MIFSRPLLGNSNQKTKLSWFDYIFTHLIPTWFQIFNNNFVMWRDLITENYEPYNLLKDDNPAEECYDWFWTSINLDETYPKYFLEDLMEMCDRIDRGEEKLIPFTLEDMKRLSDLVDGVELDD